MKRILFAAVIFLVLLITFQNCSNQGSFRSAQLNASTSSSSLASCSAENCSSNSLLPVYLVQKNSTPEYQEYLQRVYTVASIALKENEAPESCAEARSISWAQYSILGLFMNTNTDKINDCVGSSSFIWDEHEKFGFGLFAKSYFRLYGLYNKNSPYMPNRLSAQAQQRLESEIWRIAKAYSTLEDARASSDLSTGSENHSFAHASGSYLAAQFLRQLPQFRNLRYDDGSTLDDQYSAWKAFLSQWFDARFKRGLLVEVGSAYEEDTLGAIYTIHDFSDDPVLRKKAEMYLDLSYASMAEEMLLTTRGGSKSRSKNTSPYTGIGNRSYNIFFNSPGGKFNEALTPSNLTSPYFPSSAVYALATDFQTRGIYSFKKRTPGPGIRLDVDRTLLTDKSTVRYGFATPNYMIGTSLVAPLDFANGEWDKGMGFRWQGVVYAKPLARIGFEMQMTPECKARNACATEWHGFEEYVSLQDRNVFIIQKNVLSPPNHRLMTAAKLAVYFSPLLDEVIENSGWFFVRSGNAYSALRIVSGTYTWSAPWRKSTKLNDRVFLNLQSDSPIIVITNDASDYNNDFLKFQSIILKQNISHQNSVTNFASLTFYGPSQIGKVQDQQLTTNPSLTFDSPFIRSKFNSGYIVIRKGNISEIFDNRDPNNPKHTTQTVMDPLTTPSGIGQETPLIFN